MILRIASIAAAGLVTLTPVAEASAATPQGQVAYAPAPSWAAAPPAPTDAATAPEAPLRVVYTDKQVRVGPAGEETYSAFRMRLLKPEALQLGAVSLEWSPASGGATVHFLRVIRDGVVIDALKDQKFQVIQREGGLERSMLDGRLTATLQVPGLRVGDELEFAATIAERDPTIGDHAFGLSQMPVQGMPGVFRFRLAWPQARPLSWRATRDLPQAPPVTHAGESAVTLELRDPGGVILNDGAPSRFNIRRLIEFSDFAGWSDVSRRFAPLFDRAATLSPGSPLKAEGAKIASASSDRATRIEAALRLVQDQIRYVYVGLDGGNYRPTPADETWERRFGDCKAKAAVLLALLRELKIDAEPVLLNVGDDDGVDARLPSPSVFNHVIVAARTGGAVTWLDGTRLGDRHLDRLPPPAFRWVLPLRTAGAELEGVAPTALTRPQALEIAEIDARAGFDAPAKVKAEHIVRQDAAFALQTQLQAMSAADADRGLKGYWRQQMAWVEPDRVAWRSDARQATLVLSVEGTGKPDWEGDAAKGRTLTLLRGGFFPPDELKRPREQDATAPWKTDFPTFNCYATTVRLPPPGPRRRWSLAAEPMGQTIGASTYWRASSLRDGVVRMVKSLRVDRPEVTADEARRVNAAIPDFNNNMSQVFEAPADAKPRPAAARAEPYSDTEDWAGEAPACQAPAKAPPPKALPAKAS